MLVEIAMVGIKILVSAQPLQTNAASSCHCGGAVDRRRDERWGAPCPAGVRKGIQETLKLS